VRNSSLVKWCCADNVTGLKYATEAAEHENVGRGALYERRSRLVRVCGVHRRENAGMSSDKAGENPARRKPKDS
jgi:hypothetical protein